MAGMPYYFNALLGETTWVKPQALWTGQVMIIWAIKILSCTPETKMATSALNGAVSCNLHSMAWVSENPDVRCCAHVLAPGSKV